jgi:hypothetical protein
MGYMTTITILNDDWHDMEKNPKKMIENISLGMNGVGMFNEHDNKHIHSYMGNCLQVATSHHADQPRLYLVHRNLMSTFGYENDIIHNLELREELVRIAKSLIKEEEKEIKKIKDKLSFKE